MTNSEFSKRVLRVVSAIPKGETLSYAEVAKRAGSPGAARAVGTIMAKNKDNAIPCHRIICSDGKLGAYNGIRGESKKELLRKEGFLL